MSSDDNIDCFRCEGLNKCNSCNDCEGCDDCY